MKYILLIALSVFGAENIALNKATTASIEQHTFSVDFQGQWIEFNTDKSVQKICFKSVQSPSWIQVKEIEVLSPQPVSVVWVKPNKKKSENLIGIYNVQGKRVNEVKRGIYFFVYQYKTRRVMCLR